MKQKFKKIQSYAKDKFVIPITIALNLILVLSFILVIVSAIQHFN